MNAISQRLIALKEVDLLQFHLSLAPVPLSACFVNVRRNGRADSPRYTAWKAQVDLGLYAQLGRVGTAARPMFTGDVRVRWWVAKQNKRRQDLDNLTKALNDLLTRNHILGDDSQIVDLNIKWAAPHIGMNAVEALVEKVA